MAHWIFQSADRIYNLPGALKEAPKHDNVLGYQVNQCWKKIQPGETVYLYFAGKTPGLYATATVKSGPDEIPEKGWERKYAVVQADEKAKQPKKKQLWVRVQIEQLLDPPVSRRDICKEKVLEKHQLFTAGAGTNFSLKPEQARAIERLIAKRSALGDATPVGNPSGATPLD